MLFRRNHGPVQNNRGKGFKGASTSNKAKLTIKRKTSFHTDNKTVKCPHQLGSERKWVRKRKALSRETTAIKSSIYIFIKNQVYNFLKCLKILLVKSQLQSNGGETSDKTGERSSKTWTYTQNIKKGTKSFHKLSNHMTPTLVSSMTSPFPICSYSKRSGSRPQIRLLWAGGLNLHLYERLSHELGNTFREKLNFFYDILITTKIVIRHFRGSKTVLIDTWYLYPEFQGTHQRKLWLN